MVSKKPENSKMVNSNSVKNGLQIQLETDPSNCQLPETSKGNPNMPNQAFKSSAAQFVYQEMMSLMIEARQNKSLPKNWKAIKSSILKPDQNLLVASKQQQNLSSPLVNLVICPICKITLWGTQKYVDHYRECHAPEKNQKESQSSKFPLMRVRIPLCKQRKYKTWPFPEKMTYFYTSYEKIVVPQKSKKSQVSPKNVKKVKIHNKKVNRKTIWYSNFFVCLLKIILI